METNTDIGSYIPARDAALRVHLHPDYISRLARQSRIHGRRVGRRWYVDPASLDVFLQSQNAGKEARRGELKDVRRKEYEEMHTEKAGESAIVAIEEAIAENVTPQTHHAVAKGVQHAGILSAPGLNAHALSFVIHPGVDFFHKVIALMTAFVLVFGAYGLFDREFGAAMLQGVAYSAGAAVSLAAVFAGASADCHSNPERMAAAAHVSFENILISLDNLMPSGLADKPLSPLSSGCSQ